MNIIKKWIKTRKQDKDCHTLLYNKQYTHTIIGEEVYQDCLAESIGKLLKTDKDGIPAKGQLAKLGIKAVDFRKPLENEVFLGKYSFIEFAKLEKLDNRLKIPGEKVIMRLAEDPVLGKKRFILKNIKEPVLFFEEEQELTQNTKAVKLIAENPLEFNLEKVVPTINGIPVAGALENVGVEIVAYRLPKKGEFFVSRKDKICDDSEHVNLNANCGFRFILEKINSEPAKPTTKNPASKPVKKSARKGK